MKPAFLSILLCALLLAGCVPTASESTPTASESAPPTSSAIASSSAADQSAWPEGALFYENFSRVSVLTKHGWEADLPVVDETVTLDSFERTFFLDGVPEASAWTDYTVEARLTVSTTGGLFENSSVVSLVGRLAETSGYNYGCELGLVFTDETSYLRMFDRTQNRTMAGNRSFAPQRGQEYRLKLTFCGGRVKGFVDDVLYLDCADDGINPAGSIGFRVTGGYSAVIHEVLVREPTQEEISASLANQ